MTAEQNVKPREFWVIEYKYDGNPAFRCYPRKPQSGANIHAGSVHVVEMSALQKANIEIDRLKQILTDYGIQLKSNEVDDGE